MEDKIEEMYRDIDRLMKEWDNFRREQKEFRRDFEELKREIGLRDGQRLSDQVENMERTVVKREDLLTQMSRDVTSIRKGMDYNEINMKEVMKALSFIYRNVDELEDNLVPNRSTS